MALTPGWFGVLLACASLVAIVTRRLRLPYTVGLVVSGILLALLHTVPDIELTKQLVFDFLLPPLIFEASLYIRWTDLRRDFGVVTLLAIVGVLIAAGVAAAGMHFIAGWDWPQSVLFGVLIAATDPVSVIAALKETKIGGRLQLLMEAESLFNDGTAAVLFAIATSAIENHAKIGLDAVTSFAMITIGGVFCGLLVGTVALLIAGRSYDHLVETTSTLIAAFGSFWLADRLHLSGVLSTLSAGILIGNFGSLGSITNKGRDAVETFWEFVAFVANSMVFILIGLHLGHASFAPVWLPILVAIVVVLLGRAFAVYPCCAIFTMGKQKIEMRHQHILFWGGLRGAIALALALGLPLDFPAREPVIATTFAVVAFSVIIQGMTIKPLMVKLGISPE